MRFYGFEYIGKPKTPAGPHHPTTSRQSIAGELAVFLSRKERDNWAQSKPKRTALTSEEARQHCQGLTLTAYRHLLSQLEDEERTKGSRKTLRDRAKQNPSLPTAD